MLHALLRGDSLLDSVHRNLMTKRQAEQFFGRKSWGRPVWEMMPATIRRLPWPCGNAKPDLLGPPCSADAQFGSRTIGGR